MAICYKQRKVANQVASMRVIGDVAGKDVVLVDDICDTGRDVDQSGRHDERARRQQCPRRVHTRSIVRPRLRAD